MRVIHFEVMAEDPERAAKFYSTVFGWEINKWEGPEDYWLVKTGSPDTPGIDGGIGQSKGQPVTVNTISVESVDAMAKKVTTNGGKIVVPKMAVPGVGWLVYCQDTEGLVFGLMEEDSAAG